MTKKQGEWFCNIDGRKKEVGNMCKNNPNPKQKCRDCFNLKFMKFIKKEDKGVEKCQ